jgi:hypothetical protein
MGTTKGGQELPRRDRISRDETGAAEVRQKQQIRDKNCRGGIVPAEVDRSSKGGQEQ